MHIFLAAPFTYKLVSATGLIEQNYRTFLENLIQELVYKGHLVTSAHVREEWGAKLESPEIAIQNDFNSIKDCNLLIAFLENPPSPGVHMELGFAAAIKKPIIIIHGADYSLPYLVNGLSKWTKAINLSFESKSQLLELLDKQFETLSRDGDFSSA